MVPTLSQVRKDARKFFRQLKAKGFTKSVIYRQTTGWEYDTSLGKEVESSSDYTVIAYLTNYNKRELINQVRASDLKCLILADDLDIVPKIDDIIIWNDKEWRIVEFAPNPFEVVIELQLRASE